MRPVTRRPRFLLVILVYVALDFSLPSMPGAFVFEPTESVETVQARVGRAGLEVVVALPLATDPGISPLPQLERRHASVVTRSTTPVTPPVRDRLPRRKPAPASPTEDPH